MTKELIINSSLPEIRIALLEDGKIQELLIERETEKTYVGNIYKGKVTRVLPGMQAAFVDIGLEKAAFLYVDDVFVHHSSSQPEDFSAQEEGDGNEGEGYEGETEAEGMAAADEEGGGDDVTDEIIVSHTDEAEMAEQMAEQDDDTTEFNTASGRNSMPLDEARDHDHDHDHETTGENDPDDSGRPVGMSSGDEDEVDGQTVAPSNEASDAASSNEEVSQEEDFGQSAERQEGDQGGHSQGGRGGRRDRFHRGARNRHHRPHNEERQGGAEGGGEGGEGGGSYPDSYLEEIVFPGSLETDRTELSPEGREAGEGAYLGLSESEGGTKNVERHRSIERSRRAYNRRIGFKQGRGRDRKIRSRSSTRPMRRRRNIDEVLQEGMEVIVQIAKDPIAAKGARLTCHVSLPGRHLVCMPTINHIGVSKRIENSEERRVLRNLVERNRKNSLGYIVRTASGSVEAESRIRHDMNYLASLWDEIMENSKKVSAPALIYEDLNPVLRTIRDWVEEDVTKIRVDSRYVFNEIKEFTQRFMPDLSQIVELYQGDVPVFDAFGISTELHRSLERRVWLKSGGYIVIDQAEALVAIDVNTGRYVGKKNLEDTILKTNLEAVDEIAHQLRVRNLGGIIIIDLIDMEKFENRRRVYRALESAIRKDRTRPTIVKISELGLIEMTRKRTRDTMVRVLCQPCNSCEGRGFIKSKITIVYEILREIERAGIEKDARKVLVQAHPDIIDMLALDENDTLTQLERRYKKQVYLQSIEDFHAEQFEVVSEKALGKSANVNFNNHQRRDRGRDRDRNRGGRSGGSGQSSRDRGGRDRYRDHDRDRDRGRERPMSTHARDRDDQPHGGSFQSGDEEQQQLSPRPPRLILGQNANRGDFAPRSTTTEDDEVVHAEGESPSANRSEAQDAQISGAQDGEALVAADAHQQPVARTFEPRHLSGAPMDADEEDRLAYLRAQAAQDAALAVKTEDTTLTTLRQPNGKGGGRGGHGHRSGGMMGKGGPGGGRGGRNRGGRGRGGGGKRPRRGGGGGSGGGVRSRFDG